MTSSAAADEFDAAFLSSAGSRPAAAGDEAEFSAERTAGVPGPDASDVAPDVARRPHSPVQNKNWVLAHLDGKLPGAFREPGRSSNLYRKNQGDACA